MGFDFAALNFTRADLNRYRYRLLGVDRDWVDAGAQRSARYAGLGVGRYTFEVIGSNNDGVWSQQPASFALRVLPPLYLTWWFRIAVLVVVAGLLGWLYRTRVKRLLEIERMRLRIATDLHDELGSELSGIALTSAIVGRNDLLPAEDRARLADVEATSHKVMDGLRDIVWYVNPEHDRFESLVDRMRGTARRLSGELTVDFQTHGLDRTVPLDMRTRRQLYLIFKELLTNAVKHSGGSRVSVTLRRRNRSVELTVEDWPESLRPSGRSPECPFADHPPEAPRSCRTIVNRKTSGNMRSTRSTVAFTASSSTVAPADNTMAR